MSNTAADDPAARRRARDQERYRRLSADPAWRAKETARKRAQARAKYVNDAAHRERERERNKLRNREKRLTDPAYVARAREHDRARYADPLRRAKLLAANRERNRKRYAEDPAMRASKREYGKMHKERIAAKKRDRTYGLDPVRRQALFVDSRGVCFICGQKMSKVNVDHCHRTGRVRALLCTACNLAEGFVASTGLTPTEWAARAERLYGAEAPGRLSEVFL